MAERHGVMRSGARPSLGAPAPRPDPQEAAPLRGAEAIAALLSAEGCPERIETHLNEIHLGPDRVFKRKKAVTLPFVDFAPLAEREAACRREVAVNRAYAPKLYTGLRPILRAEDHGRDAQTLDAEPLGALELGAQKFGAQEFGAPEFGALKLGALIEDPVGAPAEPPDAIVDWVVEMRRFAPGAEFDRLAARGALTPALIRGLADRVAAAHRAAPKRPAGQRGAPPETVIAQTRDSLAAAGLETLRAPAARWAAAAAAEASRHARLIAQRRRHGFPRRLHGDLHLGNICLFEGAPTPFDAIEFSEEIATVDPLYDVAFTAMDLLWRDEPALAQLFLSRYLGATRDYSGLALWPLFLSLRAAIRAMTAGLRGEAKRAAAKLAFAEALLRARPTPRLLVVAGLSGTGKSRLSGALAPALSPLGDAVILSSDATRKRLFGRAPESPLPQSAYTPEISALVYRRLMQDARRALSAGACAVLDGVFARPSERDAAAAIAAAAGAPFAGFELRLPLAARLARVEARTAAGQADPARRGASDAGVAVARAQETAQEAARAPETAAAPLKPGWRALDAAPSPNLVAAEALAALDLPPALAPPTLRRAADALSEKRRQA